MRELMVTKTVGLVMDDDLLFKFIMPSGRQLRRGRTARLARIKRNLLREIKALDKEQRRIPKNWWVNP